MVQQEIRFIPSTVEDTIITFSFSTDYSTEEITDEINRFLTYQFCVNYKGTLVRGYEMMGNFTRVPLIKYKLKMIRDNTLWSK